RGHFYNWYDTRSLKPLLPQYVSTVDSGNFLAALWALRQGMRELSDRPILGPQLFQGLSDTFAVLAENRPASSGAADSATFNRQLSERPTHLSSIIRQLRDLEAFSAKIEESVTCGAQSSPECVYWASKLKQEIAGWNAMIERYLAWAEVLENPPKTGILSLGPHAHTFRRTALALTPSLRALAVGPVPGLTDLLALRQAAGDIPPEVASWLDSVAVKAEEARVAAKQAYDLLESGDNLVHTLDREMDMRFLYDPERRLFATGYNVSEQRLERSYYDLLASEARLSSFLAIARSEVPTEHWWALGRPFGFAYFKRPLLSWSGTMFEYLMPLLLTKSFANSLLDRACRVALDVQIAYARRRGIPWGISESAYSALDGRQVYQYRAFGVPGLALKRGVEEDFVVSPYSSALALAVDPRLAAKNLRRNGPLAKLGLRGRCGFYEAIDFTRHHGPHGERGLVVHAYMAHHQGMSLVAIDNALNADVMRERFHADARVRATASLLYERIPVAPSLVRWHAKEAPIVRLAPIVAIPAPGRLDTPDTSTPMTCLLSNGDLKVMLTAAGGGYTRWGEFDVTRWRADTTTDGWGKFCYLKDLETGFVWSIAHQPAAVRATSYRAVFSAEKAEIRRRDRGIEAQVEVAVSPEDDAEVWRVTLINRSSRPREIELTTYAELALAPHANDRSHQAFNKLFIETAMVRDLDCLLAWRRERSPDEPQIWAAQLFGTSARSHEPTQFETDRARFVGRGRTPRNPEGLEHPLTGAEGYVLDPIFSLRKRISLPAGERTQIAIVTVVSPTRDQALGLANKYRDLDSADRAISLAWTQAQLELRHLRMKPVDAQLFQQLAGYVLYPHFHLRAPSDRIAKNRLGQSGLWAHGISGDLPIVIMSVDDPEHLDAVDELLAAHTFWHVRGLSCDLVILNEEAASYDQPLQIQLQRLIAARSHFTGTERPGGVFLRPSRQIAPDDLNLLLAAARVVLVAARGPISQQIGSPPEPPALPRPPRATASEEPSPGLSFLELAQFNGVGGFGERGREYAIYLGAGEHTPRPWSNVMANPKFGALMSEEGGGFAWAGNSQSNRLVPWSNDPISDAASDAIYIYDPELNTVWTPTARPIRENDPYRARHGLGYTVIEHNSHAIEQELTTFVPVDASGGLPVRVQVLRITNRSSRPRRLKITFYAEWVLGGERELSQSSVVTNWDIEGQCLMARNSFSPSYGGAVAFAACSADVESFTGDRAEILGRNGSMSNPQGARLPGLSGRVGGGFDPCAALQVQVSLEPGATTQTLFFLGQTPTAADTRALVRDLRRDGRVAALL
ncbi:MAG TPA: glucoamylase family protein, partial [Fimbriimonadaceae bacterium]|nr:glucoamylase family protein [Fimbriimonadaceae bacterium]